MVIRVVIGNKFWCLCKRPTTLSTLANKLLGWSSNKNLKFNKIGLETLLLLFETKDGWIGYLWFATEMDWHSFLLESPIINFSKSSFNSFVEVFTWSTNDALSAKSFALDVKLSDQSFISFKNNNEPRINPCATSAWILSRDEI